MNATAPRILMCPPDHYGVEYEINPWMNRGNEPDRVKAVDQWRRLYELLGSLGATIELLEPAPGLPDMVFTANAGLVYRDLFVTSRFRHAERMGESAHFERWFADRGCRVIHLATRASFEGAGDALFCGDTLFAGYLHRSEMRGYPPLARLLDCPVLGLELVDPRFYHLDTCFCPLAPGVAMFYSPAFDDYGQSVIRAHIPTLVEVTEADALCFGCNAVVIGRHVVMNTGCQSLSGELARLGYEPHATDLSEFLKAGGSAKCLTLRLDGEEAADWKRAASD